MVMSFMVDRVRNFLIKNGEVYTLRPRQRAFFRDKKGELEKTWFNEGRCKPKITNVEIREITNVNIWSNGTYHGIRIVGTESNILHDVLDKSGFDSVFQWMRALWNFHKRKGIKTFWLYHVKLRSV